MIMLMVLARTSRNERISIELMPRLIRFVSQTIKRLPPTSTTNRMIA